MQLTNFFDFRQIYIYLLLIRYPNLVLIGLTQMLIFYHVCKENKLTIVFAEAMPFVCIMMVCILTAAAGYVVNDIADYPIDVINKPSKIIVNQTIRIKTRPIKLTERLTEQEVASHALLIEELDKDNLWTN